MVIIVHSIANSSSCCNILLFNYPFGNFLLLYCMLKLFTSSSICIFHKKNNILKWIKTHAKLVFDFQINHNYMCSGLVQLHIDKKENLCNLMKGVKINLLIFFEFTFLIYCSDNFTFLINRSDISPSQIALALTIIICGSVRSSSVLLKKKICVT